MEASARSLHAKLYRFTYTSDLPKNLCPYFWKLVLGFILFIPNLFLQLPVLVANIFTKEKYEDDCKEYRIYGGVFYFVCALVLLYVVTTYQLIKWAINAYSYNDDLATIGGTFNAMIIVLVVLFFIQEWKDNNDRRNKKPSLIVEFVKAKYNRYCPQIQWTDTTTEDDGNS